MVGGASLINNEHAFKYCRGNKT